MPSFLLDTLKQAMASKSVLAFLDFQNISSWRQTTLGIGIVAVLYNPIIQLLILVTSDTQTSNSSTYTRELYAITSTIKKWKLDLCL